MKTVSFAVLVIVVVLAGHAGAQKPAPDWPQWRGPSRDGVVASMTPPKVWPPSLTLAWKADVGAGYASPIVVGSRVYMFSRQEPLEVLQALDAGSGKSIWRADYPAPFKAPGGAARHGEGPKSTPAYADGKLFTLGASGILSAFDAASGKRLWQKPAPDVGPKYGTATSPLVERGLVIAHVGGHDRGALTAFDVNTGAVRWAWDKDGPGYASPIAAELSGTRQIVTLSQDNLVGLDPGTGQVLWQQPFKTNLWVNVMTPLVYRDTVIVSGNEIGVQAFTVAKRGGAWTIERAWVNTEVPFHLSNPVLADGTLYGQSNKSAGQFCAIDAATGRTLWKTQGREADSTAVARAGNVLLLLKDSAELIVAQASPKGFEPIQRYTVADSATYAAPAIVGNRLFVKDTSRLALWTF